MFNNSFLIIEVSPANKEKSVPINRSITVRFVADMNVDTIGPGTIMLQAVNGESVPASVTYDRASRTAYLKPDDLLSKSTSYRLFVLGGTKGVKTAANGTMPENKIYEFRTTEDVMLSAPKNLVVNNDAGHLTVSWVQPNDFDPTNIPTYEVAISSSNMDPDHNPGAVAWPIASDAICDIVQTSIKVGRHLNEGSYVAYVRAVTKEEKGPWASTPFYVEKPEDTTAPGTGSGNPGSGITFEVLDTFPKDDQVNIIPDSIRILFSDSVDMTSVLPSTVYILPKKKPTQLNLLDLMTSYSSQAGIEYILESGLPSNIISLQVDPKLIQNNTEYTVIIRESVQSMSGEKLGEVHSISFKSAYYPLYGDADVIRDDLKNFLKNVPDRIIYDHMQQVSLSVQQLEVDNKSLTDATVLDTNTPRYLSGYVQAQVAYDLLVNAFLDRSSSAGSVIKLGDLSVDNSKSTSISSALSYFKSRIKPWLDQLHGIYNRGYAKPVIAVRGESGEAYPDYVTRDVTDIFGT